MGGPVTDPYDVGYAGHGLFGAAQRKRDELEREALFQKARKEYIDIVRDALEEIPNKPFVFFPAHYAQVAVDALMADGVKFVRMGTWDDEEPEKTGDPGRSV